MYATITISPDVRNKKDIWYDDFYDTYVDVKIRERDYLLINNKWNRDLIERKHKNGADFSLGDFLYRLRTDGLGIIPTDVIFVTRRSENDIMDDYKLLMSDTQLPLRTKFDLPKNKNLLLCRN